MVEGAGLIAASTSRLAGYVPLSRGRRGAAMMVNIELRTTR